MKGSHKKNVFKKRPRNQKVWEDLD